ncbi:BtrH N-terminal domain-containing protein [Thermoactinospora rubra]|uniref:BtrH N-terminal domain-containing protein n=1 Tax=Thermoactinospora rubra TaxID=1088767 RepID=UPI000A0F7175|nr:BtrH N-terminal domain-containing protein [Thermoactinospora rubra]
MILHDVSAYGTRHCETSALGVLLRHQGLDLSEPMLFGLGSGLGFVYWQGFLGGRVKPLHLTRNLAERLGLELTVRETSSPRKAWQQVREEIDAGRPVGLQLDSFHLEYFTTKIHFGGHVVAVYGYDDRRAYLVDTDQQGGAVTTSLESLAAARAERGPMTARNLSFTLAAPRPVRVEDAIGPAIRANAAGFLAAPISNLGHRGIAKAAARVAEITPQTGVLMERGGTGGALFRNLYRDFLAECLTIADDPALRAGHAMYAEIAPLWSEAAAHIERGEPDSAAAILRELAGREQAAMETLSKVTL